MVAAVLRDWRAALRRHCTVLIAGEHTTVICLGLRLKSPQMSDNNTASVQTDDPSDDTEVFICPPKILSHLTVNADIYII